MRIFQSVESSSLGEPTTFVWCKKVYMVWCVPTLLLAFQQGVRIRPQCPNCSAVVGEMPSKFQARNIIRLPLWDEIENYSDFDWKCVSGQANHRPFIFDLASASHATLKSIPFLDKPSPH